MRATILLVAASCLLTHAQAQTLLTTHGDLLAVTDQPVPGPSGAYFEVSFDTPVIADDGTVLFRVKMYGGDVSGNANSRALFLGTTAANLSMMLRSADPAPGLAGLALVNGAGNNGIQAGFRLTPDGRTFWSSYLSGPGVASSNDTAMFGGFPESMGPIVREGDAAPGTSGAVFSGDRITSTQFTTMNRNGAVLFQSTLSGGDVVGATNNQALYTGTAGALSIVVRKGDTVLPGPVTASTFPTSSLDEQQRTGPLQPEPRGGGCRRPRTMPRSGSTPRAPATRFSSARGSSRRARPARRSPTRSKSGSRPFRPTRSTTAAST